METLHTGVSTGFVAFWSEKEVLKVLADRPHIINDKLSAFSSLRNILQRCARNASILGGTPLQIQCTFIPSPSASAFSNPEDFQCHHFGTFSFSAALRSKFDALSIPSIRILPLFLVLPTQMDCALNSLPQCIDDKETDTVGPAKLGRKQLTLKVNRVLDDRPHIIGAKPLKIQFMDSLWSLAKVIPALFPSSSDLSQKTSPRRHYTRNSQNMENPFSGKWNAFQSIRTVSKCCIFLGARSTQRTQELTTHDRRRSC
ncbi:hypothetical protein Ddc_16991 [Ditylenchus destructor]|nr:hypothetical protein Ddc_16991 [Ditylenchus destructor]